MKIESSLKQQSYPSKQNVKKVKSKYKIEIKFVSKIVLCDAIKLSV